MRTIIKAELLKMNKRNIFLFLIAFNGISIMYALGIYFGWSWVSFEGEYDAIRYVSAMWHLLFLLGIPLVLFMYLGASIIGTERIQGQLILEVTRAANTAKLITAKFISMLIVILTYFITNIIISFICYSLFVSKTQYAMDSLIVLDAGNIRLIVSCIAVVFYLVSSVFFAMLISIRGSAIFSTIAGIVLYTVLSLGARTVDIGQWVPGYLALYSLADFNALIVIYQLILGVIFIFTLWILTIRGFKRMDL